MKIYFVGSIFILIQACGTNIYSTLDSGSVKQEAASEMEKGHPERAIALLEDALKDDPTDYEMVSLLSAAYAESHGVSIINIALSFSKSNADSTGSSEMTALWPSLPEGSDSNIEGVTYAIELLEGIPEASKTPTDYFKLALLIVCSTNLVLKSLDVNGDYTLSAEEISAISETQALAILTGLSAAVSATASASSLGSGSQKASSKISNLYNAISGSSGGNESEKVQNYFGENK